MSLLALDWRKAFDSLHVESLIDALRRFGLPAEFLVMVFNLLSARQFYVSECGAASSTHPQLSGISQCCTMSPLLFIIVTTVLLHDAVGTLSANTKTAYERGDLADLVYVDDILLIGVSANQLNALT